MNPANSAHASAFRPARCADRGTPSRTLDSRSERRNVPEIASPQKRSLGGGDEKINILLVDDQQAKLLSYEAILDELGENLIKASSATEALEQLLKCDIAIILIDVCMPDLDGFQLATMIREHPRFQSLAIIFISAVQVANPDLLRGYGLGAVDYVPVPVTREVLRAKVKVFVELYRKTRQLKKLNAELESRVAERTAELAQTNAELEERVQKRTREREEALAQVHEMQKIESLGQLTGGVAHDFNNLLMVVLANLELVKKHVPEQPQIQRWIDGAIQGAQRGAALTERMLAFARRQELRPEIVNVAEVVDSMAEMLRSSLGPTIRLVTDFEAVLAPIRVDRNQFELALLNLAINARDAMPPGGHLIDLIVTARSERIEASDVTGLKPGEYVRVGVKDTGNGMDEATLRRATEPFFTTKDRGRGTGLGLSTVHGFIVQSGGAMRISSQPSIGTNVELWLPVTEATRTGQPKPAPASSDGRNTRALRVLVVDDDLMVGAGTGAMIQDLGHVAIEVASAAGALEVLRSELDIDIVITDYAMPEMNGSELATEIRRIWPHVPVIMATGYADAYDNALDLPRLDKPYKQQALAALIETLLEPRADFASAPISPSR
jgi:signal transduction histidine kinase